MTRLAVTLLTFAVILSVLPSGFAGPACAKKHFKSAGCIQRCRSKWGFPGHVMGTDPWGVVMQKPSDKSAQASAHALDVACGVASTSMAGQVKDGQSSISSQVPTTSITNSPVLVTSTSSTVSVTTSSSRPSATVNKAIAKPSSSSANPVEASAPPSSPPATTSVNQPKESPKPAPSPSPQPASDTPSNKQGNQPASGGSSGSTSSSDINAYLAGHNSVRAQHGAAPLTWSDDLSKKAQQWANNCVFEHSGGSLGAFGENLAAGTGNFGISAALQAWTDEVKDYDPSNPVPSHFTQVVWKGTTQVGCALQSCSGIFSGFGKAQYYVCEYSPQGNIIGRFAENVQA